MTDKVQKIREEVERIKTNANKRGAISKHTTMVVCDTNTKNRDMLIFVGTSKQKKTWNLVGKI